MAKKKNDPVLEATDIEEVETQEVETTEEVEKVEEVGVAETSTEGIAVAEADGEVEVESEAPVAQESDDGENEVELEPQSDTTESDSEEPAVGEHENDEPMKCPSTPTDEYVILNDAKLYKYSGSVTALKRISGKFYIWDYEQVNGRYRITDKPTGVGVTSDVIGWINACEL